MKIIAQNFSTTFSYPVHFTDGLFHPQNSILADMVSNGEKASKILFFLDEGVYTSHPDLPQKIKEYADTHHDVMTLSADVEVLPGGEAVKNDARYVHQVHEAVHAADIDRHSYIAVIGGGALIDAVGYAAATAHRGIRLIRIPTTVLAQNDAAVGVKNGINAFGKKNFLGTFATPHAVLNDSDFLTTLDNRDWRSGISEAVKVALLKEPEFFVFLEEHAEALHKRDMKAMKHLVYRCARLHLQHIAGSGDPFETGSSRPLDFGHWSAHKLEQLTDFELRHGEAVAIGIALDATYSYLSGLIDESQWHRIIQVFLNCGFELYVPELEIESEQPGNKKSVFYGLEEFREHLGGTLTIMLLEDIGRGVEVHEVHYDRYREAMRLLRTYESSEAKI